ncbi:MAG TPA: GDYXXLXY domain-containing protein [Spirochaetota bacterium]|nr:GDYXXLXY domain-containing protein [Spirochaetota bacterium]
MKTSYTKVTFFTVIAFQFFVIIFMLFQAHTIIGNNKIVKLKCNLYDPYNFMKGRYINLSFDIENEVLTNLKSIKNLSADDLNKRKRYPLYCILEEKDGYHHVVDASFEKPSNDVIFIKTKIYDIYSDQKIILKLNFREYYLQEDHALEAENILRNITENSLNPYLILAVGKDGKTAQKGFMINEMSIEKFIIDKTKKTQ